MTVVSRLRRDLALPGRPVGREELPFLVVSAVAVVVVAQWNEPGSWGDVALLVVAAAALVVQVWLPRVPVEAVAVAVAGPVFVAVGRQGHLEVSLFLVTMMTVYAARSLGSTLRASLIGAVCCLGIWGITVLRPESYGWQPWVAAEVFLLVLGRTLFRQGTLIAELERVRRDLVDLAVAEERRRIARELHDLAGHALAAVLLHVTGARHVLRRDLDEAERALQDAERAGRAGLDQIRATVALLRTTELGTDPPVPDAGQLADLVTGYRRAGLVIETQISPRASALGGPTGVALHRICQESLSNVARHAAGNRVRVTVDVDDAVGQVQLVVDDRGRRPAPSSERGAGFGLVGMRERAQALGGTVTASPTPHGWRVLAVLPWDRP